MNKEAAKYFLEIGGKLFVRREFLILEKGISDNLLKSAVAKQSLKRKEGKPSLLWLSVEDPANGKRKLILVDSIPISYREKYHLPSEQEIRESESYQKERFLQVEQECLNTIETNIQQALKEGYVEFLPQYIERYKDKKKASKKARKHAVLRFLIERGVVHEAKTLREAFMACSKQKDLLGWGNYKVFKRNLERAEKDGVESIVVHGLTGKESNNKKFDPTVISIIEALYSDPRKYSHRQILIACRRLCTNFGIAAPSKSTISLHLSRPEVQNRLTEFRYGLKKYSDTISAFAPRNLDHAGSIWQIDGTPIQFHHIDRNGKQARLYLFYVLDVRTTKVVGFSLGYSEDRFAVTEALKMAVNINGHLPGELVYDNFSALKTEEIKGILNRFNSEGVITRAAKVGNPQDKGNIERAISSIQTGFQSLFDGYMGQGITSKRRDARATPEHIQKVYSAGLPNEHEMRVRVTEIINFYNLNGTPKHPTPAKLYRELEKPHVKPIDPIKFSFLFWSERCVKVSRSMIKLTVQKQEEFFEIYDNEHKNQLNGTTVRVRYDEADLSLIHVFDEKTDRFICECRQIYKLKQAQVEQTELDVKEMQIASAKRLSHRLHNHKKTEEIMKAGGLDKNPITVSPYSVLKSEALENENSEYEKMIALQTGIDLKQVREYIPVETVPEFLHKKTKALEKKLNDKLYKDEAPLTPYKPEDEKTE